MRGGPAGNHARKVMLDQLMTTPHQQCSLVYMDDIILMVEGLQPPVCKGRLNRSGFTGHCV